MLNPRLDRAAVHVERAGGGGEPGLSGEVQHVRPPRDGADAVVGMSPGRERRELPSAGGVVILGEHGAPVGSPGDVAHGSTRHRGARLPGRSIGVVRTDDRDLRVVTQASGERETCVVRAQARSTFPPKAGRTTPVSRPRVVMVPHCRGPTGLGRDPQCPLVERELELPLVRPMIGDSDAEQRVQRSPVGVERERHARVAVDADERGSRGEHPHWCAISVEASAAEIEDGAVGREESVALPGRHRAHRDDRRVGSARSRSNR